MSIRAFMFKKALKFAMPRTMDIMQMRRYNERFSQRYKVSHEVLLEPETVAGVPCEWATTEKTDKNKVIIYLHGGGFCRSSIAAYRAFSAGIALASGISVLTVDYRLAPEYPYPAVLEDTLAVYRGILLKGYKSTNIVFMGDSAGGGLCLAAAMKLRDQSESIPAALGLISPTIDLTMSSGSYRRLASKDPVCFSDFEKKCFLAYANGSSLTDPYISPLYGSFEGLPPMILHCGEIEICADDYIRTREKATAEGADITFKMWKGMFHMFTVFCENTPEGMQSFLEIVSWIKQRTEQAAPQKQLSDQQPTHEVSQEGQP